MWRRIGIGLGVVVIAGLLFFFFWLPGLFEATVNGDTDEPLLTVSARAEALHDRLTIIDMHGDTLLWKRDLLDRADRGHIDLPRLEQGHVAIQIFSSVTKTPRAQNYDSNPSDTDNITLLTIAQLQPVRTWFSLTERSLWHAEKLRRAAEASDGRLRMLKTSAEIDRLLADRAAGKQVIGAIFSAEGLHNLEGDIANLDRLYDAGMRMAGLTHFFDNRLAGSMHGEAKGGLTDFGRQVMRRMEEKGIIVDIAHASHAAVADILKAARRPVVSSHGGVQAVCGVNRNLTDEEIRGVARTGGVVGIGYWDGAICSTEPRQIALAIKHVRDLVGIEHVGLGSDFDGAVTTRFHTGQVQQVTEALVEIGFTDAEIAAVMGGNTLRVLRAGLKPMARPAA